MHMYVYTYTDTYIHWSGQISGRLIGVQAVSGRCSGL